jgi:hypothetical protein
MEEESTTQNCKGRQKVRVFQPFGRTPDEIGPQKATWRYCARNRHKGGANKGIKNTKELPACAKRSRRAMGGLEWAMRQRKKEQR